MGTISDKLMRIINTKEDIRQALISKGYDVPTSIPFKEYAKMILDLPCNADSFPDIEGIVARYSASGLTNEQMAANPVWVDKTGNGRDLQLKNFSWKRMSGVGGYVQDFNDFRNNATVDKIRIDEQGSNSIKVTILTTGIGNAIYIPKNIYQFNKSYFIKISSEGYNEGDLSLSFYAPSTSTATTVKVPLNPNGITEIHAIKEDDFLAVYLNVGGKVGSITIEQLPLYPGALVFDGVDDYGVCDNFPILTKEKGYTVVALRQWIEEKNSITALVSNSKNWNRDGAFVFEYNNLENNYPNLEISFGSNTNLGREKSSFTYQTSKLYNGKEIKFGEFLGSDKLIVAKANENLSPCSNVAIWELVFLDHDATEEELTKIKDYFVKTYPWLFFDQAWTVVGKTNEDEDRATIANITGNGNDLVLSNFGFAEGSGYGLYNIQKFTHWNHVADRGDIVKNGYSVTITNSKITGSSTNYNTDILYSYNSSSTTIIFKVTGLVDGQKIFLGRKSVTDAYVIGKDGIYRSDYNIPQEGGKVIIGIGTVGFTGECNITIEQIPEYEGYLVTDGVDDEIVSAKLIQFADKFTIVGDWKFMEDRNDNAGLLKSNQIYIYNATTGMRIYLKQGSKNYPFSCKKINALTSDGWVYDEKWDKYKVYPIGSDIDISNRLFLGFYSSNFTKIALKNLGIYNDQLLSKDDCIKAYNYLQTLKSK
jgi:hypothetical protein